jgi:hypothetical protein
MGHGRCFIENHTGKDIFLTENTYTVDPRLSGHGTISAVWISEIVWITEINITMVL